MRYNSRHAMRWLAVAYVLVALLATWQRGVVSREHTTFAIFRQSFVHLSAHSDLYALYPAEHGAAQQDRFKYSPSAAMLLAPLARMPYATSLLVWNLLNVGLLFFAVARVLSPDRANLALLMLLPEVFTTVQASSSNALIAALMLLSAYWIARGRAGRAATAVAIGAAIKIFPLAMVSLASMRGDRKRFGFAFAVAGLALLALPLLVVSPAELLHQYQSWQSIELSDALDVEFGMSFIRALRTVLLAYPNWAFQVVGIVIVLLPLTRRDQWTNAGFQLRFVCSLMLFVVLFNHQAERQSMVIAAAGAAIWMVSRPMLTPLVACYIVALTGISVVPYAIIWIALQVELAGRDPARSLDSVRNVLLPANRGGQALHCRACGGRVSLVAVSCGCCGHWLPAWSSMLWPRVAVRCAALVMLLDEITPGHFLFRWNLWDLVR